MNTFHMIKRVKKTLKEAKHMKNKIGKSPDNMAE